MDILVTECFICLNTFRMRVHTWFIRNVQFILKKKNNFFVFWKKKRKINSNWKMLFLSILLRIAISHWSSIFRIWLFKQNNYPNEMTPQINAKFIKQNTKQINRSQCATPVARLFNWFKQEKISSIWNIDSDKLLKTAWDVHAFIDNYMFSTLTGKYFFIFSSFISLCSVIFLLFFFLGLFQLISITNSKIQKSCGFFFVYNSLI